MIRINQIRLPMKMWGGIVEGTDQFRFKEDELLCGAIRKALRINKQEMIGYCIVKKSLDARNKEDIRYLYSVDVKISNDAEVLKRNKSDSVVYSDPAGYEYRPSGAAMSAHPPIIAGSGPAGLFCAYELAEKGYCPIVLERGDCIEKRVEAVNRFWAGSPLDPESNVQFGEGGAGTFSDGKLNTMVKDAAGRNHRVLSILAEHGAPGEILYLNKPHIGTDRLRNVIISMRKTIEKAGGRFLYRSRLTGLIIKNHTIGSVIVNENQEIPCEALVLAIGHSARDTFSMLESSGLTMSAKPFAIGVRMEHSQDMINRSQYGASADLLPPADYKLTCQTSNGRGVYSFCMCPGGFVVNASSEPGMLAVNGMSNYDRGGRNANSAIIVSVTPEDYSGDHPLAGMEFQRKWERKAYEAGRGKIPVQTLGDFLRNKGTKEFKRLQPEMKGLWEPSALGGCLPEYVISSIIEAMPVFDRKIHGFADGSAIVSGVETRTSSPVRIHRDDFFESNIGGIYPCGEGAGYAGGITSAAMDGIKVFEAIGKKIKALKG